MVYYIAPEMLKGPYNQVSGGGEEGTWCDMYVCSVG